MSFDSHNSTTVLDIRKGMSFLHGLGLRRRQHGHRELISTMDHDSSFRLGYGPTEVDFKYMAQLHKEMFIARLSHTTFDYPLRLYTMNLEDYFVGSLELLLPSDKMISRLCANQEEELRPLVHQI